MVGESQSHEGSVDELSVNEGLIDESWFDDGQNNQEHQHRQGKGESPAKVSGTDNCQESRYQHVEGGGSCKEGEIDEGQALQHRHAEAEGLANEGEDKKHRGPGYQPNEAGSSAKEAETGKDLERHEARGGEAQAQGPEVLSLIADRLIRQMTSPATSDYNWSALGPLMEDDGEGRQAGTSSQAVSANAWPREGDEGEGGEGSNFWEGSRASDEGGSVRGAHRGRSVRIQTNPRVYPVTDTML